MLTRNNLIILIIMMVVLLIKSMESQPARPKKSDSNLMKKIFSSSNNDAKVMPFTAIELRKKLSMYDYYHDYMTWLDSLENRYNG